MRQYEVFELCFEAGAGQSDLTAEFELGGKRVVRKGFFEGGVYKVRFLPVDSGLCRWKVWGAASASGEEECLPADNGRHGPVRASGLHFEYDDKSPYYPFGTTVYALIHQPDELVERTLFSLSRSPFNKLRFCIFPKHYEFNHNEPPFFAFEKGGDGSWDVNRPCTEFWQRLEKIIARLDKMGIECDLILFHPYDRWGFSHLSKNDSLKYLDYLVRRLSAYPNVWWSLANEYDLMDNYSSGDWKDFARFISESDGVCHLLSNHNCFNYWDFTFEEATHCSIQDIFVSEVPELQKKYQKPVIFDECCYEGNIELGWGNISAFELAHRFWTAVISGGYCTHGETFLSEDDILWWSKGGELKGESPARIDFLRSIVESLPSPVEYMPEGMANLTEERILEYKRNGVPKALEHDFWVRGLTSLPDGRIKPFIMRSRGVAGHCGDRAYIWYYGRSCPAVSHISLPEGGKYDVEIIDIWEMTRTKILSNASGETKLALPGKEGIAVLAVKTD